LFLVLLFQTLAIHGWKYEIRCIDVLENISILGNGPSIHHDMNTSAVTDIHRAIIRNS